MLIYKTTNKLNNKCYIGQTTKDVNERIQQHLNDSRKGSPYIFHNAIRKYGIDNFNIEILEDNVIDKDSLNKLEIFYIAKFGSFGERGYNMTIGGEGGYVKYGKDNYFYGKKFLGKDNANFGKPKSNEIKRKISKSLKGKFTGEKNPMYGRKGINSPLYGRIYSDEHKRKMSVSRTGIKRKPFSDEHKRKISEVTKGEKNGFYGKQHSEETRQKMKKAWLTRPPITQETRQKMKEARENYLKSRFCK